MSPSPRPTFDGPALIRRADVTRHVWGDPAAGEVFDWIYASTERVHMLVFGLPPGGAFRHSEDYRTIFAADEVLHVLQGTMVLADPQQGEVQRVGAADERRPGERRPRRRAHAALRGSCTRTCPPPTAPRRARSGAGKPLAMSRARPSAPAACAASMISSAW